MSDEISTLSLDSAALGLVLHLRRHGHTALWVGGCVRDRLLQLPLKDIDIATDARPESLTSILEGVRLVGAQFGVALVPWQGHWFEVATFRRDGRYVDLRRPESVTFGTLEDDARRRDFTINALYYDPVDDRVIDLVGGRDDLAARRLRTVGDPAERFAEDALRLLRAVRFAARLGFAIDPLTWASLCDRAPTAAVLAPERVRDELTAMLAGPAPGRALRLLDDAGLLAVVLPEVLALKGCGQSPDWHPEGDVFVHTLLALDHLEPRTRLVAWGTLLHDIAKPATRQQGPDGRVTFYGHERVGAEMAEAICTRLRFSTDDTQHIAALVARHMRFMSAAEWNRATMRRFLAADTIDDDLALHRADCLAAHGNLSAWRLVSAELAARRAGPGVTLPPPLLTGADLIALGHKPGPAFRFILEQLAEAQLNGQLTDREQALAMVPAVAAQWQQMIDKADSRPS